MDYMKLVLIVYAIINFFVFAIYGIDKYKAIQRKWRIPEATLLGAAVFGVIGALGGMYLFRHKIRKPKFFILVPLIFVLECCLAVWLAVRVF